MLKISCVHDGEFDFKAHKPSVIYMGFKRVTDTIVVLLLSPLLLVIGLATAILVKKYIVSKHMSVIFKQQRTGLNGVPFTMYKFRTMNVNASDFTQHMDNRVNSFGRFLRKYRLDELPQFWNVLIGDMSIIGPRPEQTVFTEQFAKEIEGYMYRHKVRPGITGWAQIMMGYAATVNETKEKLLYDLYYLKYFGPIIELKIILRTIKIIFTGFGAR